MARKVNRTAVATDLMIIFREDDSGFLHTTKTLVLSSVEKGGWDDQRDEMPLNVALP